MEAKPKFCAKCGRQLKEGFVDGESRYNIYNGRKYGVRTHWLYCPKRGGNVFSAHTSIKTSEETIYEDTAGVC